ncbi:MAG TPA: hypothetical protein VHX88_19460 [Solirubrobacteraceae bacterium]|nr:hypothetical protein [Solirubrobacteraceae bacterium]
MVGRRGIVGFLAAGAALLGSVAGAQAQAGVPNLIHDCGNVAVPSAALGHPVSRAVQLYRPKGVSTPSCKTALSIARLWAHTPSRSPRYPAGYHDDSYDKRKPLSEWLIDGPHHVQVIIVLV